MVDQRRGGGGDTVGRHRQADAGEVGVDTGGVSGGAQAAFGGEGERQRAADRDRFAVEETVAEPRLRLECVAEGVAEVEEGADITGLALVGGDDPSLGGDAGGDRVDPCRRVARHDTSSVRLEPREEGGVAEKRGLGDLGIARPAFAWGQGVEQVGIDDDGGGLVERADQVLARARIDRGLAADRAVDLRQQRRRDLDERAPPAKDRGGEPGQIADDAAAERNHRIAALDPARKQCLDDGFEGAPVLLPLAGRDDQRRRGQSGGSERSGQRRQMEAGDGRIGDDRYRARAGQRRDDRPGAGQRPGRDFDIIATRVEADGDNHRCAASAATIARTVASCGVGLLLMWICASA